MRRDRGGIARCLGGAIHQRIGSGIGRIGRRSFSHGSIVGCGQVGDGCRIGSHDLCVGGNHIIRLRRSSCGIGRSLRRAIHQGIGGGIGRIGSSSGRLSSGLSSGQIGNCCHIGIHNRRIVGHDCEVMHCNLCIGKKLCGIGCYLCISSGSSCLGLGDRQVCLYIIGTELSRLLETQGLSNRACAPCSGRIGLGVERMAIRNSRGICSSSSGIRGGGSRGYNRVDIRNHICGSLDDVGGILGGICSSLSSVLGSIRGVLGSIRGSLGSIFSRISSSLGGICRGFSGSLLILALCVFLYCLRGSQGTLGILGNFGSICGKLGSLRGNLGSRGSICGNLGSLRASLGSVI